MDNNDIAKEWLVFAKKELDTAIHLFNTMYPKPIEIICFHCQQAAEKALKGYLVAHKTIPPRIHDLLILCGLCVQEDDNFNNIIEDCSVINMYGVQPRYPFTIEITEDDAEKATQIAKRIYSFVVQKVRTIGFLWNQIY